MRNDTLKGCVDGVHGDHLFLLGEDGATYYALRSELIADAQNPYIGMRVSFVPHRVQGHRRPFGNEIRIER